MISINANFSTLLLSNVRNLLMHTTNLLQIHTINNWSPANLLTSNERLLLDQRHTKTAHRLISQSARKQNSHCDAPSKTERTTPPELIKSAMKLFQALFFINTLQRVLWFLIFVMVNWVVCFLPFTCFRIFIILVDWITIWIELIIKPIANMQLCVPFNTRCN